MLNPIPYIKLQQNIIELIYLPDRLRPLPIQVNAVVGLRHGQPLKHVLRQKPRRAAILSYFLNDRDKTLIACLRTHYSSIIRKREGKKSSAMAATVANPATSLASGAMATSPGQPIADGSNINNSNSGSALSHKEVETIPPTRKFKLSDFTLVRTLGTGTFARVCLVRPASDTSPLEPSHSSDDSEASQSKQPEVYALKILRKTEVIKLKQIDHVRHERAILAQVAGHPFITNLLASFSDHDSLYMLLDYVPGGELFSYLRKLRRFDERVARFYGAEIVLVLEYLHEAQGGVAYRDLKPENLLLDADGHIKLVDFGFAKRLGHDGENPVETYTLCGTPEYLAPEVIHNKGHTTAVDWWALGILLYEFLTGYPPFWHQNPMEIYKQ